MTAAEQKAAKIEAEKLAAAEAAKAAAEAEAKQKAEAEAAAAKKAAEPTSPKLIELREKKLEFKKLARTFEPDSDDENAALMEAYKIDQLIKAEIANIVNTEAEAKAQIARNERVQLNGNQLDTYKALLLYLFNNPGADTPIEIAVDGAEPIVPTAEQTEYSRLNDLFKAAKDIVETELLAKFGGKAAPKAAGAATTGAAKTSDTDNTAIHVANLAAGMTDSQSRKAMEAAGVARSTAWHTVNNYNKANGKA